METFSPATRQWFAEAFRAPTRVQEQGWPVLVAGSDALLVAPTGSGKTLAAFLWAIDRCCALPADAPAGVRVLYVSPLKALVYDIERNLRAPLAGIRRTAERLGQPLRDVRVDVRTGDTPQRERDRQRRRPADILVTTPESLFLILGSRAAETLRAVHTVILDEIHVFAPSKRGVHLALSLERLEELVTVPPEDGETAAGERPQRIGLSATVRPMDEVAGFLSGGRPVERVDASEPAHIRLRVTVPVPDMDDVDTRSSAAKVAGGGQASEDEASPSGDGSAVGVPEGGGGWARGGETSGVWPAIYPEILDLILAHRSTIVFTNSRGLCERLAQRLNDLHHQRRAELADGFEDADEEPAEPDGVDLVRSHHGSVSHERRAEIEEALKAGRLRGIVATSSLELGIDMGAVDLVILVESPGSVARGLQRVGRAGHGVGEVSEGVIFPKFKGDLLECAVVAERMLEGTLEAVSTPRNPLDVLAQQIVGLCLDRPRSPEELLSICRRAWPYRELSPEGLGAVLDMLSGQYPSDEFADLRPRLSWDRATDEIVARRGARTVLALNAGTIPDRGLYSVHLGAEGPRLGELDEEMVYESRPGDVFLLGASSWRIQEITRDRVLVAPAPGEAGRMPFWHGDGPGRPSELGTALGDFLRAVESEGPAALAPRLRAAGLDELAVENLTGYLQEQLEATGALPSDRVLVIERFRDELGDWRVCILSPFGARVHGPWAMVIEHALSESAGFDVEASYTDDGVVLRLADTEELPDLSMLFPDPDLVEDRVIERVADSAVFATLFREAAARALLLPRRRGRGRVPLWLQRLRSKTLLGSVKRFSNFPVVLEAYRETLRDVFDVPALEGLLRGVRDGAIRVVEVETVEASPFARSLVFAYIARYLYEQDAPLAERKAQALTLDRNLLRELLGQAELRELLDGDAIRQVEEELQGLADDWRARDPDELHDLLRRIGDLSLPEVELRCRPEEGDHTESEGTPSAWLERLAKQRRALELPIGGELRWIAADDAARYRDGLGVPLPSGLPDALLVSREEPVPSLVRRWCRVHGPFEAARLADRYGLDRDRVRQLLRQGVRDGWLVRGEILPGGSGQEWCDAEVLRRIKRRTLARLRGEVAPVAAASLSRFLASWHGLVAEEVPSGAAPSTRPGRTPRPEARLGIEEALLRLEGVALPWSALHGVLLPARVPGYGLEALDQLARTGEWIWVGAGALGPRDGRVQVLRREVAETLLEPPSRTDLEAMPFWSEVHGGILESLEERGARFSFELTRDGARATDVDGALWDLVWAGAVTNDSFLPLLQLGRRQSRSGGPSTRIGGRRSRGVARTSGAAARRARRAQMAAGGRWSLVAELVPAGVTDTERRLTQAHLLLERYGVVSREMALAESVAGGFEAVYPVLREMEEGGAVRRGFFVEELSGRQFALPAAVERLRADHRERTTAVADGTSLLALPAVDPANPWGALFPWPEGARPDGPRPRRVPGAWVFLADGELLAFLEAGARRRSLVTFREPAADRELLERALRQVLRHERRRSLRIARVDGDESAGFDLSRDV